MPRYLLHHEHRPGECGAAFASFNGHDSRLRHRSAISSCIFGGHAIWWDVEAISEAAALQLLPYYVAQRTTVTAIARLQIP
ncbi:MAG TPA: hypothetical protein VII98_15530 [Solirubrobacteraceae bacterium]